MSLVKRKSYKFNDYSINQYSSLCGAGNNDLNINERRYSDRLKVTANGIMYMGIWSFIKTFMGILDEIKSDVMLSELEGTIAIIANAIVIMFIFLIVLVLDLSLRFIIWRGALSEATTGKKKNAFVVSTVILMCYGAYAIGAFFHLLITEKRVEGDDVIKLVFDVTSLVLLWWVLAAAFKLRKTREELSISNTSDNKGEEALQ